MTDVPRRAAASTADTGSLEPTAAIAATPHFLASSAAINVIERGGNAVDGAIAANAVLGVVLPDTCGIGGDLFALVHRTGAEAPAALNASGRGGAGWSAAGLRSQGLIEIPIDSPASVTVPGCVDGWLALLDRYGTLPLSTILAPAIGIAEGGFPVSTELAASLARLRDGIGSQLSAAALYPDGDPPAANTTLTRPDLASTLRHISEEGRDAFYRGRMAEAIIEATDDGITQLDLDQPQAEWIEPVGTTVFGMQGWTIPPNSQGYLTLAAAWIFQELDPPRDPEDPAFHHALVEAYRSVAWERDDLVSDATTAPLPPAVLVDPTRLRERVDRLSMTTAASWPRPSAAPGGTAYFCVRDGSGMGVSFIQSNYHGIGARISAGDTGVFLHDRGAGFNLVPGHPNELQPGRRPLHTLSPTLWTRDGDLQLLLGTRGGQYQPQTLLQVAANRFWAGMDSRTAQERPRWQLDGLQVDHAPELLVESRMSPGVVSGLESRGHRVSTAGPWMAGWGPVSMIEADATGARGVADPRVSTTDIASRRPSLLE